MGCPFCNSHVLSLLRNGCKKTVEGTPSTGHRIGLRKVDLSILQIPDLYSTYLCSRSQNISTLQFILLGCSSLLFFIFERQHVAFLSVSVSHVPFEDDRMLFLMKEMEKEMSEGYLARCVLVLVA